MTSAELLIDAFDRIRDEVGEAVRGLAADELAYRVDEDANSIAWLVWHLTRIQDDHVAEVAGTDQVWTSGGVAERVSRHFEPGATEPSIAQKCQVFVR